MVMGVSNNEIGNLLPPLHGLFFLISSKEFIFLHNPTDRIMHTMGVVTPVVEYRLELRNSSMGSP